MLTRVGGPLYDSPVQDAPPDSGDELEPLLEAWSTQDPAVRERLIPLVYAELRRLAQHYMKGERQNHTLQPTALVNEMYMRLARDRWCPCHARRTASRPASGCRTPCGR
jgi:ECF sigma factor